jgi:5'-nucleotidase
MQVVSRLHLEPFSMGGKPTLIIDMDGVSVQFVPAVCKEHNRLTGDNLYDTDVTDWNMGLFGIERSTWQKPGFFRNLEPMPGAIETLKLLKPDFRLTIATDCMGVDFVQQEKQEWLQEYLPFVDDVYFLSDKSAVPGDLIFDDAPHHLAVYPGITVKMLTPYNAHTISDYTVTNWDQFYRLVKELF